MQSNAIRKRALLMGAAWTLAMAAVPSLFKSSPVGPIYLSTMSLLASGWVGILLHALAAERRAAGASVAAAGSDTRGVVDGLAQAMGAEMQRAGQELVRVDELLGHAIDQLMDAFNGVSDYLRREKRWSSREADRAQGERVAAERVAQRMDSVVTAMQFRDVVGQKLGHVRRELEVVEQTMRRVRELYVAEADPASYRARASEQRDLAVRVKDLLQELQDTMGASPVRQELMHAGEVDLF